MRIHWIDGLDRTICGRSIKASADDPIGFLDTSLDLYKEATRKRVCLACLKILWDRGFRDMEYEPIILKLDLDRNSKSKQSR